MSRPLLLPLAAIALLAAGCTDDDSREPDPAPRQEALADLDWDVAAVAAGALDTCGSIAVLSVAGANVEVALIDEDRVVVPDVTPPAGSDLVVDRDWTTTGGCIPAGDGPVVVVEARQKDADLNHAGPKLVAGFTPSGEQLWSVEVEPTLFANEEGRGSVLLDGLVGNSWRVLDARTGEEVASSETTRAKPVTTLGRTLVDDLDGGLVDLVTGRSRGKAGDETAQVDDGRMLLQTVTGLQLVTVPGLKPVWKGDEDLRLTGIWTEAADLSTSTVVTFGSDGTIVGVDLRTGKRKWVSDALRDNVDGLRVQVGSGVVVFGAASNDPESQVVLDSATGEVLTGAEGYVVADQGLLIDIVDGAVTPVTVADLR